MGTVKIEEYDGVCPKCGSMHYTGEQGEFSDGEAWQTMICDECGTTWREVYFFAFGEIDEDEE